MKKISNEEFKSINGDKNFIDLGYYSSDGEEVEDVFKGTDKMLKPLGLEIEMIEGFDCYVYKIIKKGD